MMHLKANLQLEQLIYTPALGGNQALLTTSDDSQYSGNHHA